MENRRGTATFVLTLGFAVAVSASAVRQQAPTFRAGVDLVQIDVSVLDQARRPVRGLTASDFTILENEESMRIAAVSEIEVVRPVSPPAVWTHEVNPDTRGNDELADHRLFVIVIDDATLPFDPGMLQRARQIAYDVIERLGPADRAALVFTRDNRHAQDFTADRRRLRDAVGRLSAGFAFAVTRDRTGGVNTDASYYQSSLRTLDNVSRLLIGIPNRRKALIYISVGVPLDMNALEITLAGGQSLADTEMLRRLIRQTIDTLRQAQLANVAMYCIDPAGLDGLKNYLQSIYLSGRNPGLSPRPFIESLRVLAGNTGGRAIVDTNDFTPGIERMFEEMSAYYLIGYERLPVKPGAYRRLEVKVNRPGVDVRARSGAFVRASAPELNGSSVADRLVRATAALLPDPGLPMKAALMPFAVPGRREAAIVAAVGLRSPPGSAAQTMQVLTKAFTVDGDERASATQSIRLTPGSRSEEATVDVLSRLDLPAGRYQVRVAAHQSATDTVGSLFVDLDVQDFTSSPLSLSGVAILAPNGRVAAPAGIVRDLLPVVPTSLRAFRRADTVELLLSVYQGASQQLRPVQMSIIVRDRLGERVVDEHHALAVERFGATRNAEVRWQVPVSRLAEGPHLVSIEASFEGRSSVKRDVTFEVNR